MLMSSHRHTPADLRLWAEMEDADLAYAAARANRLARLERQSTDAIRAFASVGPCYASTSHGKDSTLLWWLLRLAGADAVPVVHLRVTPTANPHGDDVRDAMLGLGHGQYAAVDVDYGGTGHPLFSLPWEASTAKRFYGAFAALNRQHGRHMSGIRAAEAKRRKMRMLVHGLDSGRTLAPLGWWRTADVYAYAASRGVPLHPNYGMLGGGRWDREHLRVAELGDRVGDGMGRAQWEREYYGDVLNRLGAG